MSNPNWREYNKKYREMNREKCREWGNKSYHRVKNRPENIVKRLLNYARARAAKSGLEFSLQESDIYLPTVCPILGVTLGTSGSRYSFSIDRKDPTKGYTSDNIWIISKLANSMKWDSTKEERISFARWVLSEEGGSLP